MIFRSLSATYFEGFIAIISRLFWYALLPHLLLRSLASNGGVWVRRNKEKVNNLEMVLNCSVVLCTFLNFCLNLPITLNYFLYHPQLRSWIYSSNVLSSCTVSAVQIFFGYRLYKLKKRNFMATVLCVLLASAAFGLEATSESFLVRDLWLPAVQSPQTLRSLRLSQSCSVLCILLIAVTLSRTLFKSISEMKTPTPVTIVSNQGIVLTLTQCFFMLVSWSPMDSKAAVDLEERTFMHMLLATLYFNSLLIVENARDELDLKASGLGALPYTMNEADRMLASALSSSEDELDDVGIGSSYDR